VRKEGQRSARYSETDGGRISGFEWVGLTELTRYAAVSNRTLRAWIHSPVDPLPAVRVGAKILVRKSDFDCWLEQHKVKPLDLGVIVEEMVEAVTDGR
jgi:excisionase family DNA binding protein